MSKKKKKKNKKKKNQLRFQNNNIQAQSPTFAAPVAAVDSAPPPATPINKGIRQDLIKILFISLFLIFILGACLVIRTQTSWLTRGADEIYRWMRLGE